MTRYFFSKKQEEMTIVSAETEGVKRNISSEQEAHERLTVQLHRTQGEVDSMNKELDQLRARHEELREEYVQTQRIMKETDISLDSANAVCDSFQNLDINHAPIIITITRAFI